jgi:ATP-dependent protease HslVU (ClpYQ) peptidase subunit
MSTLVMVEKDGLRCMAADTLTTFGSEKQTARYVSSPEKIRCFGDSYVGMVGWSVSQLVLESALGDLALPEVSTELELFEFARKLHARLKEDYFLNSDDSGGAYETSQMTLFVMNRFGLFGLYSNRAVDRFERFAAVGSGSEYALGAMYAAYSDTERDLPADEVARLGVEAGIEFDAYSFGPITLKRMKIPEAQDA